MLPFRRYRPGDETRLEPPAAEDLERLLGPVAWFERLHRYEVHGMEHIPSSGPAILVAPHPLMPYGMFLLGRRVFLRDRRIMRGLTDHMVFSIPVMRDLFASLGIVDGTQENGLRLLEDGQLAACMPGGALDWSRSWRRRRTLRWGDHRGYARLAVRANAPVIPTACPATDDLFPVLVDGMVLGKVAQGVLRMKRPLPVPIFVPIGLPVKLTHHVAEPQWPLRSGDPDQRALELDRRVRGILSELLSR